MMRGGWHFYIITAATVSFACMFLLVIVFGLPSSDVVWDGAISLFNSVVGTAIGVVLGHYIALKPAKHTPPVNKTESSSRQLRLPPPPEYPVKRFKYTIYMTAFGTAATFFALSFLVKSDICSKLHTA